MKWPHFKKENCTDLSTNLIPSLVMQCECRSRQVTCTQILATYVNLYFCIPGFSTCAWPSCWLLWTLFGQAYTTALFLSVRYYYRLIFKLIREIEPVWPSSLLWVLLTFPWFYSTLKTRQILSAWKDLYDVLNRERCRNKLNEKSTKYSFIVNS